MTDEGVGSVSGRHIGLFVLRIVAAAIALPGLVLLALGVLLAIQGGSLLYLTMGALLSGASVGLFLRRVWSLHLLALTFAVTWIWALAEVGLDGWALVPRVDLISILLPLCCIRPIQSRLCRNRGNTMVFLARIYTVIRPRHARAGRHAPESGSNQQRQWTPIATGSPWKH